MKVIALFFLLSLFAVPAMAADDLNLEICNDSLYQVLKSKDINTLQEREYDYFNRLDKECNQMKQIALQKEDQKAEKALGAVKTIVGIMVSVAILVGGAYAFYYLSSQ